MNREELKAEAAKLGYNLVKSNRILNYRIALVGKRNPANGFIVQKKMEE